MLELAAGDEGRATRRNRRIIVPRYGGPEVMTLVKEPLPEPGPGAVRVRIVVTGVGYPDVLMLHRTARVRQEERLLVHGAAGGVGTAVLQLGRLAGLELYGTGSGTQSAGQAHRSPSQPSLGLRR